MGRGEFDSLDPLSPHLLEAEKAPYPLGPFDKRSVDVFARLTDEERSLADATFRRAKQADDQHSLALENCLFTEAQKEAGRRRKTVRDLVEEYESRAVIDKLVHEAKLNGTWDNIKHMIPDCQERPGEIGTRMASMSWGSSRVGWGASTGTAGRKERSRMSTEFGASSTAE